jgi:cyclase
MPASLQRTTICAMLMCLVATRAYAADADPGFTLVPLGGSVSLLRNPDCNIVASAGDDGIVLVDTCVAATAEKLLAAAKHLSDKPLRFAINTHVHGDHTGGNAALQRLAPVIASGNVRTWLAKGNEVTKDPPSAPDALPAITFDGEMTLHLNGEQIRLLKLPRGHTDGDVAVFFKNANVVATGDVFMTPGVSFGDRHYGGGMLRLIESLEFLLPQIPADAKVVPGHGDVASRADVARGLEVLKQMKAVVESGVRAGKTLEQTQTERPFDKFRSFIPSWASSDKSLDGWVRDFYRELSAK